ncbi:MAG: hypothetical protein JWL99_412 [Streptomyces oryziradicis]|nr:hypothetical protein [Actinacidiphila oryziradicis]
MYLVRSPQHGTTAEPDGETLPLSALTQAALERWLPIRAQLVADLQGSATALWVSLFRNHSGVLDDYGNAIERPAGMPLQERGGVCAIRTRPSGRDGQLQRPSPAGTVPFAAPGRVLTITPTWTDQDGQEDEHEPAEDLFAEPHC